MVACSRSFSARKTFEKIQLVGPFENERTQRVNVFGKVGFEEHG